MSLKPRPTGKRGTGGAAHGLSKSTLVWLTLLAALIVLTVAALPAAVAGPEIREAPPSAEFLCYRADIKLRYALGLDRVTGFRPGYVPALAFDLRPSGKVSPVKARYPYGTCRSFATLESLESCLLPGKLRDFSKANTLLTSGFNFPGTLLRRGRELLDAMPPTSSTR